MQAGLIERLVFGKSRMQQSRKGSQSQNGAQFLTNGAFEIGAVDRRGNGLDPFHMSLDFGTKYDFYLFHEGIWSTTLLPDYGV
ncbi:hypothetical protein GCM10025794_32700 [Massilia kyonggiensis]